MKTGCMGAVLVALFVGYAQGQSFEQKVFVGPGADFFTRYHWADFNADGAFDIVEVDVYGNATVYLSDGEDFNTVTLAFENLNFEEGRLAFNDYDGDGDVDMLAAQEYALVIVNYEDNAFTLVPTGITFHDADLGKIHWLDLDGDLVLDIIHGRKIFLNHQGAYTPTQELLPEYLSNMVLEDLNDDGLPDMVVGGYESYDGTEVSIFVNEGEGHFRQTGAPILPVAGLLSGTITLLDADGDSDIDIFAADRYARGWIFKNTFAQTGQMSFIGTQIFTNIYFVRGAAGDINSDGLADIVTVGSTSVTVLTNTSAGTDIAFVPEAYDVQMETFHSMDLVDINGDNRLDVHVKGWSSENGTQHMIFENISTPAAATLTVPTGLSSIVEKNVSLSWSAVPGNLYNIEVKRDGVIYKPSCTSPSGRLLLATKNFLCRSGTLALRGLPAGSYEWRVQTVDPGGRSSAFSAANAFAVSVGPTALTLQASDLGNVKLCWSYSGAGNPSFVVFSVTSSGDAVEIGQVGAGTMCYEDGAVPENEMVEYFVVAVHGTVYSAPSNTVVHHSTLFVESAFGTNDPNIVAARVFPADFDMDGDYDLEFIGRISGYGNNALLKNSGGSFTPYGSILAASALDLPITEMTGPHDMDNDGDPDMVVITGETYSRQRVSVFLNHNGTFAKEFETAEYLGVSQLAVEDLNNDGKSDLLFSHVVGNSPGNPYNYQLLFQTADGAFEDSHIKFSTMETSTMAHFKCVDLNSDGFLDILWISADNNYTDILVNEQGTGFKRRTSILPVTYAMGVADYTGDGNVDVMVLGNEGLNLYFGAGNFTFTEPKVIPIEYLSTGPTFVHADVDQNGWPDLLLTDGYNSQVVLNRGNASFKASDIKLQRNWGSSIAITDFENDGDIDIVKLGNDGQHQGLNYLYRNQSADINIVNAPPASPGTVTVTAGLGKMVFAWPASNDDRTPGKLLTYNLWIRDENGKIWMSSETDDSGTFRRRLAPGNAGYSTQKTLNNLPAGVYTARVQALDAAFAPSSWSPETQVIIPAGPTSLTVERVLLNQVKLTWQGSSFSETKVVIRRRTVETNWETIAELPAGSTAYTDANLAYNRLYQYSIFEVSGNESTAASDIAEWSTNMWVMEDTDIANLYGSMDVADFTGDGRMDILLNGGMIYNGYTEDITRATFENTVTGWVKKDITPSELSHTSQISFANLNGDYKPDIYQHGYVWDSGYKTETFLNNGDKTFVPAANVFTNGTYAVPSFFDFDMDNDLDATAIKAGLYPAVLEVFRNDGAGNYTVVETTTCNTCPQDVAVADFDKDGDEDVIRAQGGNYQLYLNSPEGLVASVVFPGYDCRIAVTDYNSDGWPDIVLLTSSHYQSGKLYKNLGSTAQGGVLFSTVPVNLSSGEQSMLSADFNHDGHNDMAILSPSVNVLLNQGDDTFQQYIEPGFRVSLHVSGLIDFDHDGDLDIYLSGYHIRDHSDHGRKAKILLNQTIVAGKGISNMPPAAPYGLRSSQDSLGVHLSWNIPDDDHTPSEGITYDVVLQRDGKTITKGDHDPVTGIRQRLSRGRSTGKSTFNNLLVGPYSYRVQAIDDSFVASGLSAEGTFIFLPPQPVIKDTTIFRCGSTITLTAKGNDIKWYRDKDLTQLLASGEFHPQETQTVYVVQTVDGYRGIPKRLRITINEKPPAPVFSQDNPYTICDGPHQLLWAAGQNVRWYSDESLTNQLSDKNELQIPPADATYYVTQTVQGCESDALTVQVQKTTIDARVYATNDNIWTRETEADLYYWIRNGLYYRTTTVPYIPFDGQAATYIVHVVKGQCQAYSQPFLSSPGNITAVEEIPESMLAIFPNPASSHITLRSEQASVAMTIFDALGNRVLSTSLAPKAERVIDTSLWTKGVYVIVLGDEKKMYTRRIVLF